MAASPLSGVLVVDKPAGPTSFQTVSRVRRALRVGKAGHAGTLDPAATGVLVVCLEDAVRLQPFLTEGDKSYEATVAFGTATTTQDAEGRVVEEGDASGLSGEAIARALGRFLGEIEQVPPMFSAVRVGGRRLHEAARAGEEVERPPRRVQVHRLELLHLTPTEAGRRLARVLVECGKGTYVRTLAADLGRSLGVPAHLAALRRTCSSGFTLEEAIPLERIEVLAGQGGPEALAGRIVPNALALVGLPEARVSPAEARDLAFGRPIASGLLLGAGAPPSALGMRPPGAARVRAVDEKLRLVAVCEARGDRLWPVRVFVAAADLS